MRAKLGLSPGDHGTQPIIQLLVEWWNNLRIGEDPGAATWEELEPLERAVTDCLAMRPPDLAKAVSLTAKAQLLVAGCHEN